MDNAANAVADGAAAEVDPATAVVEKKTFEESKTFPLARGIKRLNGSTSNEITLRAPVALDLFEIGGMPTKTSYVGGLMTVEMDFARVQEYITRLSGIEKPALYQIPARNIRQMFDWLNEELNASGN